MRLDGPPTYDIPRIDENAPDLYIPVMSFITYVLLSALLYGTAGQFNPEVIPDVSTKCFMTQVLEVLAIRFGFYLMQAPVALLDLLSYTGYKYLGLCINMLMAIMGSPFGWGTRVFYMAFVWTASAASFFMLKTMGNNIPHQTSSAGPKREVMVLVFAASQFATMWFVSQTKFL
jgi:protein transport protein YIF1